MVTSSNSVSPEEGIDFLQIGDGVAFLLIASGRLFFSRLRNHATHHPCVSLVSTDSSLAGGDDNSVPQKLLILDARSYTAAVANRAKGGGCECEGQGSRALETALPFLLLGRFYRMPLFCFVFFAIMFCLLRK